MKTTFIPLIVFALAISGPCVMANEPEAIRMGFFEVIPTLDTKVTPIGNTWLPNGEEETAGFLLFKPRLAASATDGKNQVSSYVEILNGNYSAPGAINFVDLRFASDASFPLDPHNLIKLRSEFFNTHENSGTAFRQDNSAVPARFTTSTLNASYEYSTAQAKGRLVTDAGTYAKSYTNNAPGFRNHEDYNWGSSLYFRVLPGTDMVLQYHFRKVDYRDDHIQGSTDIRERDNKETNAYLGATWEVPRQIPGKLKIASGFKETTIKTEHNDSNSARWETNVRWEPLKDSIVTFNADRIRYDGIGMDTIMATTSLRYNWEYSWSHRLKAALAGNYSGDIYLHSNRKDEGLGLKFRMDYEYSSWLNMFIAVGRDERKSVLDNFNFNQRTFMLGIAASLEHLWGW